DPAIPVTAQGPAGTPRPVVCVTTTGSDTSESTIAVTNDGTVLYSPAQTENSMARSTDDGATWSLTYPSDEQFTALWNTVDPQVTVDPRTGRAFWIHATGQLRTAPILVSGSPLPWEVTTAIAYAAGFQVYSSDDTRRWRTADYSNEQMGDWEKVFVGPPPSPLSGAEQPTGYPDVVYACANSPFEVSGPGRLCYKSLDGGATFTRAGYVFPAPGSPVDACPALATNTGAVGNDGAIYQPVSCSSGAYVAVSHDEGASYEWFAVPNAPASSGLSGSLQISLDSADNLYATWLSDDKLSLSISRDRAKTWSNPQVVSAPGLRNIGLPAPAAGERGQYGLAYYASTQSSPDALTAYVTEAPDALADSPVLYTAALNDPAKPVFHGYGFDATPRADYVGAAFDRGGTLWAGMVKQLAKPDADSRVATTGLVGRLLLVADQGAAPSSGGAALTSPPPPRGCVAAQRLIFRIGRVPGGRVVRAVVYVNGRRLLRVRGRDLRRVSFARPRGTRLVVRIVTTNNKRGRVVTVRSYRGCKRSPLKTRHVR
ncbi:MAG TPA: sialidase family protein, partial [Solirubrobacteraceae bacterium]